MLINLKRIFFFPLSSEALFFWCVRVCLMQFMIVVLRNAAKLPFCKLRTNFDSIKLYNCSCTARDTRDNLYLSFFSFSLCLSLSLSILSFDIDRDTFGNCSKQLHLSVFGVSLCVFSFFFKCRTQGFSATNVKNTRIE